MLSLGYLGMRAGPWWEYLIIRPTTLAQFTASSIRVIWSTYQHKAWIIPVSPTEWWNCHFWGAILVYHIAAMMGVATQHQSWSDQWKKFVWHFFGYYFPFFSISGSLFLRRWSINSCTDCFCLTVQRKMLWRDKKSIMCEWKNWASCQCQKKPWVSSPTVFN